MSLQSLSLVSCPPVPEVKVDQQQQPEKADFVKITIKADSKLIKGEQSSFIILIGAFPLVHERFKQSSRHSHMK